MNFNAYVKLTPLTKNEITKYTLKNHKKENTSLNEKNTLSGSIKQEDASTENFGTTINNTPRQSSVQEFLIYDEVEATDVVEVKIEQENQIISITEDTTFLSYMKNVGRNEFICKICNANFDIYEEFLVHKYLHRSKPYVCPVCNAKFVLNAHLFAHQAEHDNYLCMRNSSVNPSEIQSSSKSNLTINPSRHYKNSKSTSELAKKSCSTITSVNLNKKLTQKFCVTDPNITLQKRKCKSWKCLNCIFTTGSEAKFLDHFDICNNILKSSSKFQCNLCIRSFETQSAINVHYRYHTNRREKISKKELGLNKKEMKNRLKNSGIVKSQRYIFPNIANIKRYHKCKDCKRHFTTRGKLNIHQKQHKQQMICNKCHKKFVLRKNFEKHLLSHKNVIMSNGKSVSGTKNILAHK